MGIFYMMQGGHVVLCDDLEGWNGEGGGKEAQNGGDVYIPVTGSC